MSSEIPLPPLEYRSIIGLPEASDFDNPALLPDWPERVLESPAAVLDFGCGSGRIARHLIRRRPQPGRYLGIDRHKGMIDWCRANLAPHAPGFDFQHRATSR